MDHEALLQTLLHELHDGVIVCTPDARIVLFNQAAADLLGGSQSIRVGDSLYSLCLQAPVEHALDLLRYQQQDKKNEPEDYPSIQFMNAATNQEKFYRCRLSLFSPHSANEIVIIFEDVSSWYSPGNLLFAKMDEFRAPITNLRAALENLTEYPEMSPVMRSAFENVLVQESINLTGAFDSLDQTCKLLMQTRSHLTEMRSAMLFGYLANHFQREPINFTAINDQTANVKVDSYGLLLVLDHLANTILNKKNLTELYCEAHTGEEFVYFDLIWPGEFLPTTAVESMLEEKLQDSIGELTVGGILHSMGGDIWSQKHENSKSTLRLALPLAMRFEN